MTIDPESVKLLAPTIIRLNKILPISHTKETITLAMLDPMNHQVINDVRMATGLEVIPVMANEQEIDTAIRHFLSFRLDPDMEKILGRLVTAGTKKRAGETEITAINFDADAPIIRMVNTLLIQAVQAGCSDVHLEAQELEVRVRFRVDGELAGGAEPASSVSAGVDFADQDYGWHGHIREKNPSGRTFSDSG